MTAIYYFRRPYFTFDGYILLLVAIYYFRRLYTTFDGNIPESTAIYCFRRIYTTFSYKSINNQKQPWKGVLNIKWKKLDNTTLKDQFPIQVWNFTKTNFFADVFKLLQQHSSGRFCSDFSRISEWFFKEQKQWPEGILQKQCF